MLGVPPNYFPMANRKANILQGNSRPPKAAVEQNDHVTAAEAETFPFSQQDCHYGSFCCGNVGPCIVRKII